MTQIYKSFEEFSKRCHEHGLHPSWIRPESAWDARGVEILETRKLAVKLIRRLHKKWSEALKSNREKNTEIQKLKDLIREMDTYLSRTNIESINSGSLFHKQIKELNEGKKDE